MWSIDTSAVMQSKVSNEWELTEAETLKISRLTWEGGVRKLWNNFLN